MSKIFARTLALFVIAGLVWGQISPPAPNTNVTVAGNVTSVQATAANLNAQVQGPNASGEVPTGNPIFIAGRNTSNDELAGLTLDSVFNLRVSPTTQSTTTVPGPTAGLDLHCDYSTPVNVGAATAAVIITGVADNRITSCGFSITSGGIGTIQIGEATTGTVCVTAFVARTGAFPTVAGTAMNFSPGDGFAFNTVTAGKDVCVITTGTATAQGILSFMVRP